MLDKKIFAKGIIRLSEFFGKDEITDSYIDDYFIAVQHINETQLERGINYLIQNHSKIKMPIPFEFLKAVNDSRESVKVTPNEKRIEPNYVPCPVHLKEFMNKRFKVKGVK